MKQSSKRILIFGVLLLALGLIFLPMMFDARDEEQPQLQSRIPPPPDFPVLPEPTQSRPVILAATPAIELPVAAREVAPPQVGNGAGDGWRELPVIDERGLPRGWSLLLGEFSDEEEAGQLLERLREAGFRAYLRRQEVDSALRHVVLLGPWLARDSAREYRQRLQQELEIDGEIIPYELQGL